MSLTKSHKVKHINDDIYENNYLEIDFITNDSEFNISLANVFRRIAENKVNTCYLAHEKMIINPRPYEIEQIDFLIGSLPVNPHFVKEYPNAIYSVMIDNKDSKDLKKFYSGNIVIKNDNKILKTSDCLPLDWHLFDIYQYWEMSILYKAKLGIVSSNYQYSAIKNITFLENKDGSVSLKIPLRNKVSPAMVYNVIITTIKEMIDYIILNYDSYRRNTVGAIENIYINGFDNTLICYVNGCVHHLFPKVEFFSGKLYDSENRIVLFGSHKEPLDYFREVKKFTQN